jgi:hypothetical protein
LINKVKAKGEGWLKVYHPLTGFNFEEYGNLKMCDDCGPNRFDKKLSNLPLGEGLFVTPRIKHIMGYNKTKQVHVKPFNLKDENDGTDYYYLIIFQCLVNPKKIRVPSAFTGELSAKSC